MPAKRRTEQTSLADISGAIWRILMDQPAEPGDNPFTMFNRPAIAAAWAAHREEIIAAWADDHPGTRPLYWWRHDAPELRRRLGGTGTPWFENDVANAKHGIPTRWVSQWDVAYYNGRMRDVHGNPIGAEYEEGHFKGVAIDSEDPPTYEAQAAYLERLGLLLPGERERLTDEDFKAEAVRVSASK
jgi:hypothetical protein